MKNNRITKQNKLGSYLAITAGVGCAASVAEGALVVQTFAPGTTTSLTPGGSSLTWQIRGGVPNSNLYVANIDGKFSTGSGGEVFTQGADLPGPTSYGYFITYYTTGGAPANGAVIDGATKNYAELDFAGNDTIREAVVEFVFDGAGGGYISGVAYNDDNTALTISVGAAAIQAVPEPSSLALLALGSSGLIARRRRKKAA